MESCLLKLLPFISKCSPYVLIREYQYSKLEESAPLCYPLTATATATLLRSLRKDCCDKL